MGIIQRQSIKHTIVTYVGIVIGAISTLYIYPGALEAYGLIQALIAAAGFLAPFAMLGTSNLSVRYFPEFKSHENKNHGFFGLMILLALAGFFLLVLFFPILRSELSSYFFAEGKSPWYNQFLPVILPLTFFMMFSRLFALFASNYHRIVVPVILEEFLIKVTLPVFIILYLSGIFRIEEVVYGVLVNFLLVLLGLVLYLNWLGYLYWKPRFKFVTKKLRSEMSTYAIYGILNGLGSKAAFRIDTLMVSGMIDLKSTGVYGLSLFIADSMGKPIRGIIGISQPIIAKAFSENNLAEIEKIYKKSSLNLLILGIFLFVGIWVCLQDLFTIMPRTDEVKAGTYVVLFLCVGKLGDLATSVNNEIINYSKYFRFNFYAIITLAIFNVIFNLMLIPKYQIVGAAMASFLSLSLFNLVKMIFIKFRFGMSPFSAGTWKVLLIGLGVYGISLIIPETLSPYLNILMKGLVISLLYIPAIYFSGVSLEYNNMIHVVLKRIRNMM